MYTRFLFIFGIMINQFAIGQDSITLKTAPRLFGANVISAGEFELNATFTPDNETVFFTKGTPNWEMLAIFSSTQKNSRWTGPQLLPFSGKYRDADPFVSHDGKRLYFISDRPLIGPHKNFDYHVFSVGLANGKITSAPELVELPLPPDMKPLYPSVAASANMYFTATTNGKNDIYVSEWKDGRYHPPQTLSFNTADFHDLDPVVAFDESFLIFASNNRKGFGGSDLYISFKKNEKWTEPINLGPQINTRGTEMAPGLSRDNKKLYFTAYREQFDRSGLDEKKLDYEKVVKLMQSYQNGIGNIYEIDLSSILPAK